MTKPLTITKPVPEILQEGFSSQESMSLLRTWAATAARSLNASIKGKTNNRGELTLAASATSTVVVDSRVSSESQIYLTPLTANAALAVATTFIAEASKGQGSFTVTHASTATTDRKFDYVVIG